MELNPDNNWTATKSDLPKKGEDGKNITYTVTYLQQQSGGFGGVNVQRVVVTQPSAVVGANGKVTLEATVKKPDPVNTTMAVPFALLGSFLTKESKGFMVNPMGIKLIANRDMLLAAAKNAAEALKKQQEAANGQNEDEEGDDIP